MTRILAVLQGMVEYGTLTGSQAVTGPRATGWQEITAWAGDHSGALLAAGAAVLLLGMIRASLRR